TTCRFRYSSADGSIPFMAHPAWSDRRESKSRWRGVMNLLDVGVVFFGSGDRPVGNRSDTKKDFVGGERLPEERRASCPLGPLANDVLPVRGDDDHGYGGSFSAEPALKVDARHASQLYVDDQAEPFAIGWRSDEGFSAVEQGGREPGDVQEAAESIP